MCMLPQADRVAVAGGVLNRAGWSRFIDPQLASYTREALISSQRDPGKSVFSSSLCQSEEMGKQFKTLRCGITHIGYLVLFPRAGTPFQPAFNFYFDK